MGHVAHQRKQLKSINTYDYIIMLTKRRKKPLSTFWEFNGSSYQQSWIPFTQGCFMPNLVEIGPVVLEKMKIWKIYDDNDDDKQQTNCDQQSSLESLAQVS